jgi:hypothetical protein
MDITAACYSGVLKLYRARLAKISTSFGMATPARA